MALQDLCELLRCGLRIHPNCVLGLEQMVVGVLGTRGADSKVRRWAINALARFGRARFSLEPIKDALVRFSDDPQTAASAIAAIHKLAQDPAQFLKSTDAFDPNLVNLAALQYVDPKKLKLKKLGLNIERASPELLKLGLIVVGLDRAPPNLFHPRHSNSEIVKVLGSHEDNIVSQYSVWAITENPCLGLADLGIDIKDIENLPPNVRAWIYRLIAMSNEDARVNMDFIELGVNDLAMEARLGLAIGLRDTFFDGLEPLVLDWFTNETEPEVRQLILDHIVRQAGECGTYKRWALELYEKEAPLSNGRKRMEANAAQTPLYAEFKRIAHSEPDLFGGLHVTNNNNFYGKVQAGAISGSGNATNVGPVRNFYDARTVETLQTELSKAAVEVRKLDIDERLKEIAITHINEAQASPEPSLVDRAINTLGKIEEEAKKIAGTSTVLAAVIAALQLIVG